MLMQHDCIIASCTALTYLLSHIKWDNGKTFQPGGNVTTLPNAVRRARAPVLLWPRVSGVEVTDVSTQQPPPHSVFLPARGVSWLFGSASALEVGGCQVIHGGLPAGYCPLSVPGDLTCSRRVQPVIRREVCGEGCAEGLRAHESKRRKEKGFWIQSSQMTCGKPQVTAELAGRKQRSPEGKMWRKQWQWWVFDGLVSSSAHRLLERSCY